MKLKILSISFTLAVIASFTARAQYVAEQNQPSQNFIERIESDSYGKFEIDIPDNILQEMLKEDSGRKTKVELKPGINKLNGYRIQVFSDGSSTQSLESRARERGNAIVAKFPKYKGQVYSFSSSPNWYTRVGNFRSQAEASAALAELKRAFPQYAGEMRVVRSQIVVVK